MCKFIAERIITCQCTNENPENSLTKRDFRLQSGNLVYKMRFSFTKRDSCVTNGTLILHFTEKKQKQQENEELSYYYERKVQELMLMYIMLIMPIVSVIIQLTYPSLARGYCAAIAGLIEILVVNLMIPNFINSRSTVYFEIGDSKYYIYKKQKDGMMQCGDASDISKATKYKLYPYEEICNMELKHEKTIQLSREQVKKLKESLKKKKERNKCNNR